MMIGTCLLYPVVVCCLCLTLLPLSSTALVSTTALPNNNRLLVPSRQEQQVAEWNSFDVDDEACVIPPEKATVEHILDEPALARGLEIFGLVLSKLVVPFCSSVLSQGWIEDWDEFWARRTHHDGGSSNAERLTHTLEELGPVYVKLGQTLASRPDAIPLSLASSLSKLQDCMQPFDSASAQRIVTQELLEPKKVTGQDAEDLLQCLSEAPIAAASVGQVYKARIGSRPVAVKVQRPGIRTVMERDAALLRTLANWVESIPAPAFLKKQHDTDRLIASELESAVEGFFDRIFEELDYRNEMANGIKFARLYSNRGGTSEKAHVVVPEFYPDLCTENVLVMEWLDGTKLTSTDDELDPSTVKENLDVIKQAIDCTLSQLFDTGVLHGGKQKIVRCVPDAVSISLTRISRPPWRKSVEDSNTGRATTGLPGLWPDFVSSPAGSGCAGVRRGAFGL